MILHKLIQQHLKHKDDSDFYALQAVDAIRWLKKQGVPFGEQKIKALDLGCGHGIFGRELIKKGCDVTFSDEHNFLAVDLKNLPFVQFNIEAQDLLNLPKFDLVICSNVLEHLSNPDEFIATIQNVLNPGGWFYLSWTNWLSPWGGHEFSPFHYFGPKLGPKVWDKLTKRKRIHTPGENLFVTSIGHVKKQLVANPHINIVSLAPRYYPEAAFVLRLPILREFLTWNAAFLLKRKT
ncbi:MAG: class I SAM-dependent methyltransferase [Verrucomicrobiales bacterium]